jgi:hypothetical protein
MSTSAMLTRAKAYVLKKYITHADDRQKAMGLAYVEAEVDDLAREFVRFALSEMHNDAIQRKSS